MGPDNTANLQSIYNNIADIIDNDESLQLDPDPMNAYNYEQEDKGTPVCRDNMELEL